MWVRKTCVSLQSKQHDHYYLMTTEKINADESVQGAKSEKSFSKLMLLAWEVRMFNRLLDQISKKHEIKIFGKTLFSFRTAKYNPATDTFQPLCAVLFTDMQLTALAIDDIMRKRWMQWADPLYADSQYDWETRKMRPRIRAVKNCIKQLNKEVKAEMADTIQELKLANKEYIQAAMTVNHMEFDLLIAEHYILQIAVDWFKDKKNKDYGFCYFLKKHLYKTSILEERIWDRVVVNRRTLTIGMYAFKNDTERLHAIKSSMEEIVQEMQREIDVIDKHFSQIK